MPLTERRGGVNAVGTDQALQLDQERPAALQRHMDDVANLRQ